MNPSRSWRGADGLFAMLFTYSAYVNLNDPDPWLWVSLYALAAVVVASDIVGRLRFEVAALGAAIYLAAALGVASQGIGESRPMKGFPQTGIFVEEIVRESLGLAIVGVWLGVLAWRLRAETIRAKSSP